MRYTRNLVAFIECLEKFVCNAIDGTATALPAAQKVNKIEYFYISNLKILFIYIKPGSNYLIFLYFAACQTLFSYKS